MITKSRADSITDSIQTLLDQDFEDWELIVKDFDRSDETEVIVKSFKDPRITYVAQSDCGIYDALNQSIPYAKGVVVGFLHVEDLLHKNALTHISTEFQTDPACDAVCGGVRFLNKSGIVVRTWIPKRNRKYSIFLGWMPPHTGMFVKLHWYRRLIFNVNLRIAGDYDWIIRFLSYHPSVRFIDNFIVDMTNSGASKVSVTNQFNKIYEDYLVLKRFYGVAAFIPAISKPLRKITQFWLNK